MYCEFEKTEKMCNGNCSACCCSDEDDDLTICEGTRYCDVLQDTVYCNGICSECGTNTL